MTLKSQIAADVASVLLNTDEFAEDVTYTPSGEAAKSIKAVFDYEGFTPEDAEDGRVQRHDATLFISTDATLGIANPNAKDQVTISSEVWDIVRVMESGNGAARLQLVRFVPEEKSSEKLRLRRV